MQQIEACHKIVGMPQVLNFPSFIFISQGLIMENNTIKLIAGIDH